MRINRKPLWSLIPNMLLLTRQGQFWVVLRAVGSGVYASGHGGPDRMKRVQVPRPGECVCVHVWGVHMCACAQHRVFLTGLRLWRLCPEDKRPKLCPGEGTSIKSSKSDPKQPLTQGPGEQRAAAVVQSEGRGRLADRGLAQCTPVQAARAPGLQVACVTASLPPAPCEVGTA